MVKFINCGESIVVAMLSRDVIVVKAHVQRLLKKTSQSKVPMSSVKQGKSVYTLVAQDFFS